MSKRRAVFLDRDGTLNEEVGYLDSPDKLTIIPGAIEAVRLINQQGLLAIVVTNQSGIARGFFDEAFVQDVHELIRALFHAQGAVIDGFYFCPHHPTGGQDPYLQDCPCRKPAPGMLIRAAKERNIDLGRSYMIGDMLTDVMAGQQAGGKGILVRTGYGRGVDLEQGKPDHIAEDVLDAVRWILKDLQVS
jgi:D-glycero-D-manno-heptose 1,7-bisphosphate phosphatase